MVLIHGDVTLHGPAKELSAHPDRLEAAYLGGPERRDGPIADTGDRHSSGGNGQPPLTGTPPARSEGAGAGLDAWPSGTARRGRERGLSRPCPDVMTSSKPALRQRANRSG